MDPFDGLGSRKFRIRRFMLPALERRSRRSSHQGFLMWLPAISFRRSCNSEARWNLPGEFFNKSRKQAISRRRCKAGLRLLIYAPGNRNTVMFAKGANGCKVFPRSGQDRHIRPSKVRIQCLHPFPFFDEGRSLRRQVGHRHHLNASLDKGIKLSPPAAGRIIGSADCPCRSDGRFSCGLCCLE